MTAHSMRSPSGTPLIALSNVTKSYFSEGEETRVLFGIDLSVNAGDFLVVMGQSGSGKSTLMNIMGCLDQVSGGAYRLAGADTGGMSPRALAAIRHRTIGFVFQSFNLLKRMSVIDNVALPLLYAGMPRTRAAAKAMHELELVGLAPYARRSPNQLSGGQQQRVAIARALVGDPPLLLADEPTGNLDTQTSVDIMLSLQRLNRERGITILLVTHESDVAAYSRRLVRMKDGKVLYDGPVAAGLQQSAASQGRHPV